MPQVNMMAIIARVDARSYTGSPVVGCCPMFESVAPMVARSAQVTRMAHWRK